MHIMCIHMAMAVRRNAVDIVSYSYRIYVYPVKPVAKTMLPCPVPHRSLSFLPARVCQEELLFVLTPVVLFPFD
jgi:hypothetical protein